MYRMFFVSIKPNIYAAVPGKFLGIVNEDPSDYKANRLHVHIFRLFFIHSMYILYIPLK